MEHFYNERNDIMMIKAAWYMLILSMGMAPLFSMKKTPDLHEINNTNRDYYNKNPDFFSRKSIESFDDTALKEFLLYLSGKKYILDAGCGIGLQAHYFLERGYNVTAFDASQAMALRCRRLTNLPVEVLSFQDMKYNEQFGAVWACRSLIHVPPQQTRMVFEKIYRALKPGGVFFALYYYRKDGLKGAMSYRNDRYYNNINENDFRDYCKNLFRVKAILSGSSAMKDWDSIAFIAEKIANDV
jgi:SAM-dependent methyltransferase